MNSEVIELYLKYEKKISEAPVHLQGDIRTESVQLIAEKLELTREQVLQTIMEWKANQS